MNPDIISNLLTGFLIGAVIGFEREYTHDEKSSRIKRMTSMGLRSYAIISFLGALSGLLTIHLPILGAVVAAASTILIVTYYIFSSMRTKDYGPTSELGAIATFFLGALLFVPGVNTAIILACTFVVAFLLSRKNEIKAFAYKAHRMETNAFVMYGVISLVILPLLPNVWTRVGDISLVTGLAHAWNVSLGDMAKVELFNPYRLWLVVTLITGIDFLGYILQKLIGGNKGWLLAAVSGGFVSSTSTTIALAHRSRSNISLTKSLVAAAILANTTSFVQMILLILPVNPAFFAYTTPFFLALLGSGAAMSLGMHLLSRGDKQPKQTSETDTVFSLASAVKFAVTFSLIRTGSSVARILLGTNGVIMTNALGAMAGMDAVTLTLSDLSGASLSYKTGITALALANSVNLITKIVYAKSHASPAFFHIFAGSIGIIIATSIASLIFIH